MSMFLSESMPFDGMFSFAWNFRNVCRVYKLFADLLLRNIDNRN